jgi:4-hydroxymandelate oxidase
MPITRREALLGAGMLAAAGLPVIAEGGNAAQNPAADQQILPTGGGASSLTPQLSCLTDFEPVAKTRVSHMAWEFFNGSVADEITMRWNVEAYQKMKLKPRVLVDVSKLDTRVTLFGHENAFPIILAPTAYHKLAHPEGEIGTARGAGNAKATMVVSTVATTSIEDISKAATQPLWFQLYVQRDRGFTKELVQRAEAAGVQALCLTVDTPITGARNREMRAQFELPPSMERPNLHGLKLNGVAVSTDPNAHLASGESIYTTATDPSMSWKDIDWLLSFAKVPLLTKGVLNPDDADRAVKAGVKGIMVSNHGARNLDTVPATIEALPYVTDRVAGRVPVIVDGGVRRGTDVLKALANGANAVMIGRPYLYGLAVAGDAGVTRVVNILQREFEMAMALTGRPTIASIDRSVLWT